MRAIGPEFHHTRAVTGCQQRVSAHGGGAGVGRGPGGAGAWVGARVGAAKAHFSHSHRPCLTRRMVSLTAAVLAILGTLAGSVVNHVLQSRSAARAEVHARAARLREQRLAAYGDFARVIMEYRRAEFARWDCAHQQRPEPALQEARTESYRLRGEAWYALYRVGFLSDDARLVEAAEALVGLTAELHHATTEEDLRARGTRVRDELRRFVELGSGQVR